MKVCPKCGSLAADDHQRFCLMDGIEMVDANSEPTVVIPTANSIPTAAATPKRKRNPLLWITLAMVMLLIVGAGVAGLVVYSYRLGTESVRGGRTPSNQGPRASATPGRSPSPLPSASSSPDTVLESSPSPEPDTGNDTTDDEVTPIEWTTAGSGFNQEPGRTYKFFCPPGGMSAMIWGVDIYTADSSICTAAVHAGVITLETGGPVTVEFRPGRSVYGSTTRNGITSKNFGEYPHSFVVR